MKFYLGTHLPAWLDRTTVPLCVSFRQLRRRRSMPRATCSWLLDSGGFSELSLNGTWTISPEEYANTVERLMLGYGGIEHVSIQDWMCEPFMLEKTGLSLVEHQQRTVENYTTLLTIAPHIPWMPVLQGWQRGDYLDHLSQYRAAGFDLTELPLVGVGSVCRRQAMIEVGEIMGMLHGEGLQLHGFGVKKQGLMRARGFLATADSMAWSFEGRRNPPMPGCVGHKNCANCLPYALRWRERLLVSIGGG